MDSRRHQPTGPYPFMMENNNYNNSNNNSTATRARGQQNQHAPFMLHGVSIQPTSTPPMGTSPSGVYILVPLEDHQQQQQQQQSFKGNPALAPVIHVDAVPHQQPTAQSAQGVMPPFQPYYQTVATTYDTAAPGSGQQQSQEPTCITITDHQYYVNQTQEQQPGTDPMQANYANSPPEYQQPQYQQQQQQGLPPNLAALFDAFGPNVRIIPIHTSEDGNYAYYADDVAQQQQDHQEHQPQPTTSHPTAYPTQSQAMPHPVGPGPPYTNSNSNSGGQPNPSVVLSTSILPPHRSQEETVHGPPFHHHHAQQERQDRGMYLHRQHLEAHQMMYPQQNMARDYMGMQQHSGTWRQQHQTQRGPAARGRASSMPHPHHQAQYRQSQQHCDDAYYQQPAPVPSHHLHRGASLRKHEHTALHQQQKQEHHIEGKANAKTPHSSRSNAGTATASVARSKDTWLSEPVVLLETVENYLGVVCGGCSSSVSNMQRHMKETNPVLINRAL
eukprot:PhM_4_TR4217/c0_g1_i1/m.56941